MSENTNQPSNLNSKLIKEDFFPLVDLRLIIQLAKREDGIGFKLEEEVGKPYKGPHSLYRALDDAGRPTLERCRAKHEKGRPSLSRYLFGTGWDYYKQWSQDRSAVIKRMNGNRWGYVRRFMPSEIFDWCTEVASFFIFNTGFNRVCRSHLNLQERLNRQTAKSQQTQTEVDKVLRARLDTNLEEALDTVEAKIDYPLKWVHRLQTEHRLYQEAARPLIERAAIQDDAVAVGLAFEHYDDLLSQRSTFLDLLRNLVMRYLVESKRLCQEVYASIEHDQTKREFAQRYGKPYTTKEAIEDLLIRDDQRLNTQVIPTILATDAKTFDDAYEAYRDILDGALKISRRLNEVKEIYEKTQKQGNAGFALEATRRPEQLASRHAFLQEFGSFHNLGKGYRFYRTYLCGRDDAHNFLMDRVNQSNLDNWLLAERDGVIDFLSETETALVPVEEGSAEQRPEIRPVVDAIVRDALADVVENEYHRVELAMNFCRMYSTAVPDNVASVLASSDWDDVAAFLHEPVSVDSPSTPIPTQVTIAEPDPSLLYEQLTPYGHSDKVHADLFDLTAQHARRVHEVQDIFLRVRAFGGTTGDTKIYPRFIAEVSEAIEGNLRPVLRKYTAMMRRSRRTDSVREITPETYTFEGATIHMTSPRRVLFDRQGPIHMRNMVRAYTSFAEAKGFECDHELNSDLLVINGQGAYRLLWGEQGVHKFKVQDGSKNYNQPLLVTVSPILDLQDTKLDEDDLDWSFRSASTPGGQKANRNANIPTATHKPTGISISIRHSSNRHVNMKYTRLALRGELRKFYLRERAGIVHETNQRPTREIRRKYDMIASRVQDDLIGEKGPWRDFVRGDIDKYLLKDAPPIPPSIIQAQGHSIQPS